MATQAWTACREIKEWQVPRVLAGSQEKTEDRDSQGPKEYQVLWDLLVRLDNPDLLVPPDLQDLRLM